MRTHEELVKKMLEEPAVRAEYDAQAEEFALLDEFLRARHRAGLTQAEVAEEVKIGGGESPRIRVGSPRLAEPGRAADFVMEVSPLPE
jgi:hypothetical protein